MDNLTLIAYRYLENVETVPPAQIKEDIGCVHRVGELIVVQTDNGDYFPYYLMAIRENEDGKQELHANGDPNSRWISKEEIDLYELVSDKIWQFTEDYNGKLIHASYGLTPMVFNYNETNPYL